jgi:hypothetical protein
MRERVKGETDSKRGIFTQMNILEHLLYHTHYITHY